MIYFFKEIYQRNNNNLLHTVGKVFENRHISMHVFPHCVRKIKTIKRKIFNTNTTGSNANTFY